MDKDITLRKNNFAKWYQDVVVAADLADQSPVRGCVVFKPYGFAIWENVQKILDQSFKKTGHQNAYFPVLIPESFLKKEQDHIEGFSPELAVVTHAGGEKLSEPLVVRPTSEAIIGNMMAKWIKSYRDLPILLNQWCNVMRWELRPRVFLRTSEFLWQEGHTGHATLVEAKAEAKKMLKIYHDFLTKDCLIPVFTGKKPAHEKFPGADVTYSLEALMQDGKALQAGTSHNLGQNFSKVFNITYLTSKNQQEYVWTTSWGVSTRLIGGIIMTHGDDDGVIMPPNIAPIKVVIIPIAKNPTTQKTALNMAEKCLASLSKIMPSWQIKVDKQDYLRVGERFYHWIKKGVPIRIIIGDKEVEEENVTLVMRHNRFKKQCQLTNVNENVASFIHRINDELYQRALKFRDDKVNYIDSYDEFKKFFKTKNGFVYAHWDGSEETAKKIKDETKATIRVLPKELPVDEGKCIVTGRPSKRRVLFAIAY